MKSSPIFNFQIATIFIYQTVYRIDKNASQQVYNNLSMGSLRIDQIERLTELLSQRQRIREQLLVQVQRQQTQIEQLLIASELKEQQKIAKVSFSNCKEGKIKVFGSEYLLVLLKIQQNLNQIFISDHVKICKKQQINSVIRQMYQATCRSQNPNHLGYAPNQNGIFVFSSPSKGAFEELQALKNQLQGFLSQSHLLNNPSATKNQEIQQAKELEMIKNLQQRLLKYDSTEQRKYQWQKAENLKNYTPVQSMYAKPQKSPLKEVEQSLFGGNDDIYQKIIFKTGKT